MQSDASLLVVFSDTDPDTLSLVGKGAELAQKRGLLCGAVLVAADLTSAEQEQISAAGARIIFHLPADPQNFQCETAVRETLIKLARKQRPAAILFSSSLFFHAVAPAVAAALHTGITADCTGLDWEGDTLIQCRPTFGGRMLATIRTNTVPVLATVRQGVFPTARTACSEPAPVIKLASPDVPQLFRLLSTNNICTAPEDLGRAQLIFAGGYGLGSREQFQRLHRLAQLTGGQVAASRGAVAAGFAPFLCQVGQTGITVRPKIYIAFGISGAVQHLSGMIDSECIVSVNSDPNAPIHRISDYSICADAQPVISALLDALEQTH